MDITALLQLAVDRRASDLHIKALAKPVLRIDGALMMVDESDVLTPEDTEIMLRTLASDAQREAFEQRHELDFSYSLPAGDRFRVNAALQRGSVTLAARTVQQQALSISDLGLPEICRTLATKPHGLVLVTGATGSGKSTTLAAMLAHINDTRACHIVTIEDPIEVMHTDRKAIITQREIGTDSHSYAEALRHVLRQDPDVILIGEMRDLETISAAITAAETGHLVLSTLHTNSAPETIDRIINVFPAEQQQQIRTQLALVLEGIITQSLLPKANGTGRVPAFEILTMTSAVRNLIREGKTFQIPNIMQTGQQSGSLTMDQSLRALVERGLVRQEDAVARSATPDDLTKMIMSSSSPVRRV